jgi:hypothetical protein
MFRWMLFLFDIWRKLDKEKREEWRYVAAPPNWKCRRGGQDYL